MIKNNEPSYRAHVAPWYDSNKLCLMMIALMAVVNFFGWTGLFTTFSKPEWKGFWHLPVIIIISSAGVFLSTLRRLIIRSLIKKTHDPEYS